MQKRAAVYARVSTSRQAEHDLSIPDQLAQARRYAEQHGFEVVQEFVEPGASATTDKRPIFQAMIAQACSGERPFDAIIVHSLSRFARNALDSGLHERTLKKHGVTVLSVTQDFADDPNGKMMRHIISAIDEHQSAENAKHTLRAMKENARNGFWNGSQPPYGYCVVEAERRGGKSKRRLKIAPKEAEVVRLAFRLYLHGDGVRGPMGIKNVVSHLNAKDLRNRNCNRFSIQFVQEMLRRTTYVGKHYFNRTDSHTRRLKPRDEWVEMDVPALIDENSFNAVQQQLARRNPKKTPPRRVNSPVLMTGLAYCGSCGGPLRLRTGKSGAYRYYTCARRADLGTSACKGHTIPMPLLDGLVIEQLCTKVLEPTRLRSVMAALISRASSTNVRHGTELRALKAEKRKVDVKIDRFYEAIEGGNLAVTTSLTKRQSKLEQDREQIIRLMAMKERRLNQPIQKLTQRDLEGFSSAVKVQLIEGNPAFRKAYLQLFIERVDVGDEEIRISGSDLALMSAAANHDNESVPTVPTFVQDWRARRDSNPRPPD